MYIPNLKTLVSFRFHGTSAFTPNCEGWKETPSVLGTALRGGGEFPGLWAKTLGRWFFSREVLSDGNLS